ncbi:MAG: HigA family addiction module antidote protein, partial [Spirochaetes bacterium]|nr:HigA family addiction module antidote protein [Spirochaetota bacterium]
MTCSAGCDRIPRSRPEARDGPLPLGLDAVEQALAVPPNRISAIVNGTRAITADTALRLGKYFGTSPEIWLDLQ